MRIFNGMMLSVFLFLAGCSLGPGPVREGGPGQLVPQNEGIPAANGDPGQLESDYDQVVISRTLGFGYVNEKVYGILSEKEEITAFIDAIQSAEKMEGIMDVDQSNYDLVFRRQNSEPQAFHLWIDPHFKHGMVTTISDTGQGYALSEQHSGALYDIISQLEYNSEQAKNNGDVVFVVGKLLNAEVWNKFVSDVKNGIESDVQVVKYTVEGDPVFNNLSFDGETIRNRYDNTHDAFGSPKVRYDFCKALNKKQTGQGTNYTLASCSGSEKDQAFFNLTIPKELN